MTSDTDTVCNAAKTLGGVRRFSVRITDRTQEYSPDERNLRNDIMSISSRKILSGYFPEVSELVYLQDSAGNSTTFVAYLPRTGLEDRQDN